MNIFQKIKISRASKKCRKAVKRFAGVLDYDDDILSEAEKNSINQAIEEGKSLIAAADYQSMMDFARNSDTRLESILMRSKMWLRESLDILAVALAVAFGIRALFFQPFKIPTGSMQPTLFGIHFIEKNPIGNSFLGKMGAIADSLLFSCERAYLKLEADGRLESYSQENSFFGARTKLVIGGVSYVLPGTYEKVLSYTRIMPDTLYKKGTVLCDGYLSSGDHLFVDRLSHYLVGLKRGDIVVFTTEGLKMQGEPLMQTSGFYYVKRLVGMPGDTLKIEDDVLYVKEKGASSFRKITEFSQKFEKIYSGKGGYQGHSNIVGEAPGDFLASQFQEYVVPEDSYFMLGDNSKFSADSRMWGVVPKRNVVGRPFVIFWPFSRRWGVPDRKGPVDIPTTPAEFNTFKEMYQQ